MFNATFAAPCLTTFCRLDELGLEAVGQHLDTERAVIECRVVEDDPWCRRCGAEGVPRDTVVRRLAMSRSGIGPRPCWCECAATDARTAGERGGRTP